jgi:hypothetical protein
MSPLLLLALVGTASASRPRALNPGAAMASLGGLAAPLEAEGWTLTPMRGATVEPGDILDPVDNQVQITGVDCFGESAVRRGQGVSATVNQALELAAKGRGGVVGAKASASKSLDVAIQGAEIAEIPVGSLKPGAACVTQLQVLASQGYDVNRFQVVQSVLYADLSLAACVGGEAEVHAPGAGASASGSDCRGVQATRTALGIRTEVASTALANVGVDITGPPPRVGLEDPDRKRKKSEQPPCWLLGPCDPYSPELYLSTTGKGASMAAADADARARLMSPFDVRFRGLASTVGGGEAGEVALKEARKRMEGAVKVPARHQDGLVYYSLAAIERDPVVAELEQRISGERSRLKVDPAAPALDQAKQRCGAVPAVRELVFLHAQLSALKMQPSRPELSVSDAEQACVAAKAAVSIGLPDGRLGDLLRAQLSARGFTTVDLGDDSATLRVLLDAKPSERVVSGLTNVTLEGTVDLVGPTPPITLTVRATGASKDPKRAKETARRDLQDVAAEAVSAKLEELVP